MAAPALAENRTACPACGQLIHPIAGRCKHCKVDLTHHRAGPAGNAPRPRLVALGGEAATASAPAATTSAAAPAAIAPAPALTYVDDARPAREPAGGGWSRRWPILVAVIAVAAIVVSLAFLVFDLGGGGNKKKKGPLSGSLGPAPEATPADPAPHTVPTPRMPDGRTPTPAPVPRADPRPAPPAPADPDLADPFGARPSPPPPPVTGAVRDFDQFLQAAIDTGCQRLTSCGGDPLIASQCTMARTSLGQLQGMLADQCTAFDPTAAQRCLASIAAFPCPTDQPDPAQMVATLMALQGCSTVCGAGALGGLVDPDPFGP